MNVIEFENKISAIVKHLLESTIELTKDRLEACIYPEFPPESAPLAVILLLVLRECGNNKNKQTELIERIKEELKLK